MSSFSYERPERLTARSAPLYMCCSDYPHSEGTATPIGDYEKLDADPGADPALFHENIRLLLRVR